MAKRSEIYASKGRYLKALDLPAPLTVVIERAPTETLRNNGGDEQRKTVLYFEGQSKCLPLNLENWDSVAAITNEADIDDWPGHHIELYQTTCQLKGQTVPCVRIRAPAQGELANKPKPEPSFAHDDMNDEIPF
jgi:hypothetical protein